MHDANYFIQLLFSGVTVGSLYALIAIGYTMVYGILRLINFAHGDIFMMAGFFMVYMSASMPLFVSIPLVLIMTVALGVLIERAAYEPLRTAPRMSVMISAIGVSYLLQNLATYITGGIARAYPDIPFLTKTMSLGSLSIKRIITEKLVVVHADEGDLIRDLEFRAACRGGDLGRHEVVRGEDADGLGQADEPCTEFLLQGADVRGFRPAAETGVTVSVQAERCGKAFLAIFAPEARFGPGDVGIG